MSSWNVSAVMHDTTDLSGAVSFWTEILGLAVVFQNGTYAYLSPLCPGGPHLAFQQVSEAKAAKNRLHLDVRVDNRAAAEERIMGLGGSRVREVEEPGFPVWTVMNDPEGNEFCIYEASGSGEA